MISLKGPTNHRIGEDFISGDIRDCGKGLEVITVDSGWSKVMASVLRGNKLSTRALGKYKGKSSIKAAMDCQI